jgi:hypothetical protein
MLYQSFVSPCLIAFTVGILLFQIQRLTHSLRRFSYSESPVTHSYYVDLTHREFCLISSSLWQRGKNIDYDSSLNSYSVHGRLGKIPQLSEGLFTHL